MNEKTFVHTPKDKKQESKGWSITLKTDITQAELSRYEALIKGEYTPITFNGVVLKSAQDVGWVIEPKTLEVDNSSPACVAWMAGKVAEVVREAIQIPPE